MKKVQMSDIVTWSDDGKRFLRIPGGWYADVPEVGGGDPDALHTYTEYFSQWHPPHKAELLAYGALQGAFESGFLKGLRLSIARHVKIYAERHPETVHPDGAFYALDGFDPVMAQALYVPFENTGKRGKPFTRTVLDDMAKGVA